MGSTDHISFTTFVHPDAKADFDSIAPTRKEIKKNRAQNEDVPSVDLLRIRMD